MTLSPDINQQEASAHAFGKESDLPIAMIEMQLPEVVALPALMAMTPLQVQDLIAEIHGQADLAKTYMQMFYVFLLMNQHEAALDMQTRALRYSHCFRIAGIRNPKLRLLVVMGPGDMQDNTPIEFVTHSSVLQTIIYFLLPSDGMPRKLPTHDVTFVAIGESSKNVTLLSKLNDMRENWPTPIVNNPQHITNCARDTCYQLLKGISGILVPSVKRFKQGEVLSISFPITIRPIDTQGGYGLQRIDHADALANYFNNFPADIYYITQYANYQSSDKLFRKLRVVLIDGMPYICHVAISSHWMVHYQTAGMALSLEKRLEEQGQMESFDQNFSVRFRGQFAEIAHVLQLDYVTIDCAESDDGRLIIFEADSRGLIHAADPFCIFPFKPSVMQKAFDAFVRLLFKRAAKT